MEIIVKKNILDVLQSKGNLSRSEASIFLSCFIQEIATILSDGKSIELPEFIILYPVLSQSTPEKALFSELLEKISSHEHLTKEIVTKAIAVLLSFIQEEILQGKEVQIINFASFWIEQKKASIEQNAKGHKYVIPARSKVAWKFESNFIQSTLQEDIQLTLHPNLEKKVEMKVNSSLLFIFPSSDFFIQLMVEHFQKHGWNINIVNTIEEAKLIIKESQPSLIILDAHISGYDELVEEIKCKVQTNLVPLLLIFANNTKIKEQFFIVPNDYLIEPIEIKQILQHADALLVKAVELENSVQQEVLLEFPTTEDHLEHAHRIFSSLLANSPLNEEKQTTFNAAFREALANSAQHGNKHRRDKLIKIYYLLSSQQLTLSITDSGKGFDWQSHLVHSKTNDAMGQAKESFEEGRFGGLGLMLIAKCVDKIEFNDSGNVVTLTQYIKELPTT